MDKHDLRTICNLIGGQTFLARLIGMHPTLMRKKIAGKVPIKRRDARAVDMALNELLRQSKSGQLTGMGDPAEAVGCLPGSVAKGRPAKRPPTAHLSR